MAYVMHPSPVIGSVDYDNEWIIDSEFSHHATENSTLISDVRPQEGNRVILTADISLQPVMKERNLNGSSNAGRASFKDVYHVPSLKKNLASVSKITNNGKYVLFGPNNVQILDNVKRVDADVLLTGRKKNSLYVLSTSKSYVQKTSNNTSPSVWHARLGHTGYSCLNRFRPRIYLMVFVF